MKRFAWVLFPCLLLWGWLVHLAQFLDFLTPRWETRLFLLWWISLAIIYDIVICCRHGTDPTITRELQRWVTQYPILLIAMGALLWHLWGSGGTYKP